MGKRIAILTSGGDAPGMNACIRACVRSGLAYGHEMFGVYSGYKGLIDDQIQPLNRSSVSETINRGGTILGTARLPEFKNQEVLQRAVEILKKHSIDAVIGIGGDGTYRGLADLAKLGVQTIGLPGTIDNDIASSDYTIGFDTCLNTIVDCVDKLRDTSSSHQRCSIVEVMGNKAGDLAAYAGLACGAELVITSETGFNKEEVIEFLRQQRRAGKKHAIVLISEKITDVHLLAKEIQEETGYGARAEVLGHMQRGGVPSARDRILASRLGEYAIQLINKNITCVCCGIVENDLKYYNIYDALKLPRKSTLDIIKVTKRIG